MVVLAGWWFVCFDFACFFVCVVWYWLVLLIAWVLFAIGFVCLVIGCLVWFELVALDLILGCNWFGLACGCGFC